MRVKIKAILTPPPELIARGLHPTTAECECELHEVGASVQRLVALTQARGDDGSTINLLEHNTGFGLAVQRVAE